MTNPVVTLRLVAGIVERKPEALLKGTRSQVSGQLARNRQIGLLVGGLYPTACLLAIP